jgi:hypothetical protein
MRPIIPAVVQAAFRAVFRNGCPVVVAALVAAAALAFSGGHTVVAAARVQEEPQKPAAQTPEKAPAVPDAKKPIVLSGCVSADGSARDLTFTDAASGSEYRLSGRNVAKYVGQRVEIVGRQEKTGVKVVGGLKPTPNVAAQAGDIDPARAAVAAAGGGTTGTGSPELPVFRVNSVSAAAGTCP